MSEQQTRFRCITNHFYNAQYEDGRVLITQLINQCPQNSMLYINRALFSSQLGQDLSAMSDLEKAIQINPFNYIAYFNLFSVLTRNNEDFEAYDNLCCSLSCMYLIKAKTTKNLELAKKSLEYSSNNIAAQLLKECLELRKKVGEKGAASSKQAIQLPQNDKDFFKRVCLITDKSQGFKLVSSVHVSEESDIIDQINLKVQQFNQLYAELNQEFGAITQKVPKESHMSNNIEAFMRERSKISTSNKESAIQILANEDYFNEVNNYETIKWQSRQRTNPESIEQIREEKPFTNHIQENYTIIGKSQNYDPFDINNKISSIIQEKSMEYDDQKQSERKSEVNLTINHQIYPFHNKKYIKINLLSFKFLEAESQRPKNVYCLITYNKSVNLRSCFASTQQQMCIWNESFNPIIIPSEPALLTLKLYSKIFNELQDEMIGQIQVMIDVADLLKLPIYNKQSEPVGQILIHLQQYENPESIQ